MNKPIIQTSIWTWIKKNLFSTWYNVILTFLSLFLVYWVLSGLISWGLNQADWKVLQANFRLFFVGRYPLLQLWRIWFSLGIIIIFAGFSWGILTQRIGRNIPYLRLALVPICLVIYLLILWLLQGGLFLTPVRLNYINGLVLTLLTAITSAVIASPLGILLAIGRQSKLPVIRWLSIAYIEAIRGLPNLSILFMAQVMVPLVLPTDARPDRVVRAIAGCTIFTAAYLAENLRGGLQSIPSGQTEAAKALGLNTPLTLIFIILPQALKAVIPSMVGQFISLFKDTSLLAIVGLVELLGISQAILANPKYLGHYGEVYLFIAFIYWLCCYSMSLASKQLEKKLNTK